MKKTTSNILMYSFVLAALFCCAACDNQLDVQQMFPFTMKTMPVQALLVKGETAEIRCELKSEGQYDGTCYTIRYFQPQGNGSLRMDNGIVLKPNDNYPLSRKVFMLYYTSASTDQQKIDVYVEDSFGQVEPLSFTFTNKTVDTGPGRRIAR
jgi:hypothetical protein